MLDAQTARVVGLARASDDEPTARVRYANAADIDEWLVGHGRLG